LSSNEIDRILTFVKYAIPTNVTEEQKKQLIDELEKTLQEKLGELDNLYKSEKEESKDNAKKIKEVEKLYEDNKAKLETEFNRLKSIVSDLHFSSTILESDYRNVFYKYSNIIKFVSGPE
jgi:flagellar capping protein FliD